MSPADVSGICRREAFDLSGSHVSKQELHYRFLHLKIMAQIYMQPLWKQCNKPMAWFLEQIRNVGTVWEIWTLYPHCFLKNCKFSCLLPFPGRISQNPSLKYLDLFRLLPIALHKAIQGYSAQQALQIEVPLDYSGLSIIKMPHFL